MSIDGDNIMEMFDLPAIIARLEILIELRLCTGFKAYEGHNFHEHYCRRIHWHKVLLCVVLAAVSVTMVKIETYVQASG